MDSRTQNYINMIATCLKVANEEAHQSVWKGKDPADFTADMARLTSGHSALLVTAAQWEQAAGGAAEAKDEVETNLENQAHILARACYNHFKKSGDLERASKCNYTKTEIVQLRDRELINVTTAIRDLATKAAESPSASGRGITAQKITSLTQAITTFTGLIAIPRSQIVNRSTLGKEISKNTATLLELVRDMDDLIPQFAGTEEGERFITAWKSARVIVDSGSGHSTASVTPTHPTL